MEVYLFFKNIIYIIEGYIKWLKDKITGKTKQMYLNRLQICQQCPYNKHGICQKCGCVINAKVRVNFLLDEEGISIDGCPKRKW